MSLYLTKHVHNFSYCRIFNNPIRNNFFIASQQRNFSFDFQNENINEYNNRNNSRNNNNTPDSFRSMFSSSNQNNRPFVQRTDDSKFKKFQKQNIQWADEKLTPFKKDFYEEHLNLQNMTNADIKRIREDLNMMVFGKNIPKPFRSFHESGIPEQYLKYLNRLGIDNPTPIQQQGIPTALAGRDVIGISRTGSGKTLTYLLPCIVHIAAQPAVNKGEGPIGLILAPTRELACQIGNEIDKLIQLNRTAIKYCTVYGGTDRNRQIYSLKQSPDILVATPGRLMDLLESGVTNFKRTTYCVLDEADRMLDMGFRDDIETILSYIRPDKQTLMWSATWPSEIQSIALNYMNDPVRIQIGSTDLIANSNIKQHFRSTHDDYSKLEFLVKDCAELAQAKKKILIFTNRKKTANHLENVLSDKIAELQNKVSAIHSDKSQNARDNIMNAFRSNKLRVLIATDVVARGIDINDIDCIIIYDFPTDIESYVHRIGRTARGHSQGLSLSYLTDDDVSSLGSKLVKVLEKSKQSIPKWLQSKTF